MNLKFNISLRKVLIIKPIGVTTKKNIIAIISGEIIIPKNTPNLNQIWFNGYKILEFNKPKTRKIKETIKDHTLISSLLITGYKAINKNTIKKQHQNFD